MKTLSILLGTFLLQPFSTALRADDARYQLSTSTGKSYSDCQVLKVDLDGVSFRHAQGMAKVLFTDLSTKWRDHFGYDAEKVRVAEQQKRDAKAKARELAAKAATEAAEASQEAYAIAMQRQTLAILEQLLCSQPYANQALPFNVAAIGGLAQVGPGGLPIIGAAFPSYPFRSSPYRSNHWTAQRTLRGYGVAGGPVPQSGFVTGSAFRVPMGHALRGSGVVGGPVPQSGFVTGSANRVPMGHGGSGSATIPAR